MAGDTRGNGETDGNQVERPNKIDSTTESAQNASNNPPDAVGSERDHDETEGLLTLKRQRIRRDGGTTSSDEEHPARFLLSLQAILLGMGLLLLLFAFWVLDSLKDPVLGAWTAGQLERHQPHAKLVSVATTLALVCGMEYLSNERKRQRQQQRQLRRRSSWNDYDVLDDDLIPWTRMSVGTAFERPAELDSDLDDDGEGIPSSIFVSIGVPYCIVFAAAASGLHWYQKHVVATDDDENGVTDERVSIWHVAAYLLFAAIESFGSLSVAAFWSFCNSTLSLQQAEKWYGGIVAMAQLGAIGGSTLVATHYWSHSTLIFLACGVILAFMLVMNLYSRLFRRRRNDHQASPYQQPHQKDDAPPLKQEPPSKTCLPRRSSTKTTPAPSGLYLILQHNYVLLILGVSCLYEVSLTCLNYQMTVLGWQRFVTEEEELEDENSSKRMTFTQFMGHYGQMVNISSLFLSSLVFPWLIKRLHLKWTLRLFPTLLLLANLLAFGALPGNLPLLFITMSWLKAMTYSIHDPATELLYLPTSRSIKFQCKFWIDVVGARIAKAFGSTLNTVAAGSVPASIRVATAPSLATAAALWWTCWRAGIQFDHLIQTNTVVGDVHDENHPEPNTAPEQVVDEEEGDDDQDSSVPINRAEREIVTRQNSV